MKIEPYAPAHLEGVVRLSLRAWAPEPLRASSPSGITPQTSSVRST
jgi:hypothetical protein